MTTQQLTSMTTSRAEFNLNTNNSSLMDIGLDVRWSSVCVSMSVCLCFLFIVCIFGNTRAPHTYQSTFHINGLSEKVVCVQREAR